MSAVQLSGVGKRYGQRWVVREVTLSLAPGERLALLGHNGAGKTTLMKLMLGLIQPDAGRVSRFGRPAADPAAQAIGFLPENVAFHDTMTGRQTLAFYARLKRRPMAECRALLERVGLSEAADRRVATYSKGMRQRLGLAQALLGEPRLLLLDEPTTGLDPALRQAFYDILSDLAEGGAAILLSSHLLGELEERTDRIAVMHQGHLVAAGSLEELRRQAGLPVELHLTVVDGRRSAVASMLAALDPRPIESQGLVLTGAAEQKMALLRAAAALGDDIVDLEVSQPGLDAVYAALTGTALPVEGAA